MPDQINAQIVINPMKLGSEFGDLQKSRRQKIFDPDKAFSCIMT